MEARRKKPKPRFWRWAAASILFRLVLIYFAKDLNLATRPEVSTPVTSLRRLAEGYWLKQSSMSPYAGSMYHGSPLLLAVLGPLTENKIDGRSYQLCSFVSVIADLISAILIRAIGQSLQTAYEKSLKSLGLGKLLEDSEILSSGDIGALVYLWNPFTIVTCIGFNTTPIENMFVIISLYGACKGRASLAAFGWTISSHFSLYPSVLIVPVILLLGYGPDAPPKKLFLQLHSIKDEDLSLSESNTSNKGLRNQKKEVTHFSWRPVVVFLFWAFIWATYVLGLCGIFMRDFGGLQEMFKRTYGFILTVKDLSPNIGVLWYFFAEVFEFFRGFFLIVFHVNILFMILPLAIRLHHRPCFLAFVYMTICTMLKSYPSVGDSALYLALLSLFINELSEMSFSFFLFCGYVGISLLSPVMHNLWIWRGTGNANFYFATAMGYACFQVILVVESVSSTLSHDRKIAKLIKASSKA